MEPEFTVETALDFLEQEPDDPMPALSFLFSIPRSQQVVERVIFWADAFKELEKQLREKGEETLWESAMFYYAILARKHFDFKLAKKLVALLAGPRIDSDVIVELYAEAVEEMAKEFGDKLVREIVDQIELALMDGNDQMYIHLFDSLIYGETRRYKNYYLRWFKQYINYLGPFSQILAHLQLKEAIPLLEKIAMDFQKEIKSGAMGDDSGYMEMEVNMIVDSVEHLRAGKPFDLYFPQYSWEEKVKFFLSENNGTS